jgi:(2Fe-2S) ferredoxin/SAM-dependent methyltransferase
MEPFRHHVYACDQRKPEGAPSCTAAGSLAVIEALRREIAARGLAHAVQVTTCGSLGLCTRGPNLVVYPEGVWYSGVQPGDVAEIVREHLGAGRPVARLASADPSALREEIQVNRARAMAAMAAGDAAGIVPDEITAMARAFMESRVLLTALELDLFTAVGTGATAGDVAGARGTDPSATARLLNALVAIGLLAKGGDAFSPTPVAARFLARGARDDSVDALLHQSSLWHTWSGLTETVRTGRPAPRREMGERGDDWTVAFIAAMHKGAAQRAPLLVEAVGAGGVRRLLDVGGGSGAYSIAFARANPELSAIVLDLPAVLPIAEGHAAAAGLARRVTTRPGDLRKDDLGSGFDLVLLSSICHMLDREENRDLLRRSFAALAPGGRVVVSDFLLADDRAAPRQAALFSINMLVGTTGGDCYTEGEYGVWLREAGFADIVRRDLPGPASLVVGTRPAAR